MRRVRLVYSDSYHDVMNQILEGRNIFSIDKLKSYFLNLMSKESRIKAPSLNNRDNFKR